MIQDATPIPNVIPAKAEIQHSSRGAWIPAFAGMTRASARAPTEFR